MIICLLITYPGFLACLHSEQRIQKQKHFLLTWSKGDRAGIALIWVCGSVLTCKVVAKMQVFGKYRAYCTFQIWIILQELCGSCVKRCFLLLLYVDPQESRIFQEFLDFSFTKEARKTTFLHKFNLTQVS